MLEKNKPFAIIVINFDLIDTSLETILEHASNISWFNMEKEEITLTGQIHSYQFSEDGEHLLLVKWEPIGL